MNASGASMNASKIIKVTTFCAEPGKAIAPKKHLAFAINVGHPYGQQVPTSAWVEHLNKYNYIHDFPWDMIIHPCSNFNAV